MKGTLGIVGAGGFGSALAARVASADNPVVIWSTTTEIVDQINREHRNERLPGAVLPDRVRATSDPSELAESARLIIIAVASADVLSRLRNLGQVLDGRHLVVHAIGASVGDESDDIRVSHLIEQQTAARRIGSLAGPALPRDLVDGRFSAVVCASPFAEVTAAARRFLAIPPTLRLYDSQDLVGVEISAVLSGAYTVGIGIADSLEMGPGPRAVLVTRIIAEGTRLVTALGGNALTFSGLAGLGNLLVRTSPVSSEQAPGYQSGRLLGLGKPLAEGRVPDAVKAVGAGVRLAVKAGQPVPVLQAIASVIDGSCSVEEAAIELGENASSVE